MSKSSGSSPAPPKLKQVDIPKTQALATQYDTQGYQTSDADYAARFPDLVAGRNYNVNNAAGQLRGEVDPSLTSAFNTAGLGGTKVGDTEFKQGKALGDVFGKEMRDRNYFQSLLSDNPQRQFGLSGGDVVNLELANANAQNAANSQNYLSRIQGYNANIAQNAQSTSALLGSLGSLGSAAIRSYNPSSSSSSPYLSYSQYAPTVPYVGGVGYTGDANQIANAGGGGGGGW